jgi:5-methylcytosine-specific restriction endonuclease McrA
MGRKSNPERRALVAEMLEQRLPLAEIARRLEVTISTVWYYACGLGYKPDPKFNRRYDWTAVQAYYDAGHTVRECRESFGFANQTWNDAVRRGDVRARPRATPLEELLALGPARHRLNLKKRMIKAGLKDGSCEECGITDWRGRPLSMALHHVNGDGRDNRLENLRLLCPNCHSQTENFAGKAVVRSIRPVA